MKVLINFSTLKSGGGQNVAMNFLYALEKLQLPDVEFYFFVANNSAAHLFLKNKNYRDYYVVPCNPVLRILFEFFLSNKVLTKNNINIIYSYFGTGVFAKKIPQVSGSADSNLYFPEIDFWAGYSGLARLKKRLVDYYRVWGLRRATALVFENQAIEERGRELFNFKKTCFIRPSINFDFNSERELSLEELDDGASKCLFLCGWQLNKNIMIMPKLAYELKKQGKKFHFIFTAPKDGSPEHRQFESLVKKYEVETSISIIGQVKKEELGSLYRQVDYVFLLSQLESFSNNIIEAWYFQRPLIISDEVWSRSICKNAALYVKRDSVSSIVSGLLKLHNDKEFRQGIIKNADTLLLEYPNIQERIYKEIAYLREVLCENA